MAVFTMVGYTALVHRAASEGKHQALASVVARNLLERVRDHHPFFEQALNDPDGYREVHIEALLTEEFDGRTAEVDRKAAAEIQLTAKVEPVTDRIYRLVVTAHWTEDGRPRQVVLESRCGVPGF